MRRRWRYGAAALVLVAVGLVVWQAWPRDPGPVAPELNARLVSLAGRAAQVELTYLGGGSRAEAHRLWVRYHDQQPYHGVKPRLIGISLVHVKADPGRAQASGDFWLVFSDRVWQPNLAGIGGPPGAYSREVILVPAGGRSTGGNITLF